MTEKVDEVGALITFANRLLDRSLDTAEVAELVHRLTALTPRALVRFDWRARSHYSGLEWHAAAKLRWPPPLRGARRLLWETLALVSGDGHERERAIRRCAPTTLNARLLTLRCIDWVDPVRDAALGRLDDLPHHLLVEALPLAEQLAIERTRGHMLSALLDAQLTDDDLRRAYATSDPGVRRAAWRRLTSRGSASALEVRDIAAQDLDVLVRAVAIRTLGDLDDEDRRALAVVLIEDRVGWIATPALAALIDLDGDTPILNALTARAASVRRAARDWATTRGIDARAVYLDRLARQPGDPLALTSLAELTDPRDVDVFKDLLVDNRARLRAAGIRALARIDAVAGRAAALDALQQGATGRATWAAADVLREGAPTAREAHVLAQIALDPASSPGQCFRVLSILRPVRWLHLAALLTARDRADDPLVRRRLDMELRAWVSSSRRIARAPDDDVRTSIVRLLPTADASVQREVAFVLKTSS